MQAGEQLSVHSGDSARRIEQSFTVRIFADRRQNFSNSTLDPRQVNREICSEASLTMLVPQKKNAVGSGFRSDGE